MPQRDAQQAHGAAMHGQRQGRPGFPPPYVHARPQPAPGHPQAGQMQRPPPEPPPGPSPRQPAGPMRQPLARLERGDLLMLAILFLILSEDEDDKLLPLLAVGLYLMLK